MRSGYHGIHSPVSLYVTLTNMRCGGTTGAGRRFRLQLRCPRLRRARHCYAEAGPSLRLLH
eukprot:1215097-Rhodomonas_salina.3